MFQILIIILSILLSSFSYALLRVGTTGDYPPFSSYDSEERGFQGSDINLAKEFAKSFNEDVRFIQTSWKNTQNDLKNNNFDIFVGGMTINPERKKDFVFSTPLISFHKAAMTQCKNLDKYKSFDDIDNPKTLVIENRGGTNEKIALTKLKKAKLLIVSDNQAAIKSLTEGIDDNIYPDIMFTDTLEIHYQHSINPKLCKILVNFDKKISYKAFMFNKNEKGKVLANKFDKWLDNNPEILKSYQYSAV